MACKVWLLSNYMQSLYSRQRVVNSECSQHRELKRRENNAELRQQGKICFKARAETLPEIWIQRILSDHMGNKR